jgi:hypothetical protein
MISEMLEYFVSFLVIGRLKPSEERINRNGSNIVAALTEDELVSRLSSCLKVLGNGGSNRPNEGSSSNNNKHGWGRSRGRGSDFLHHGPVKKKHWTTEICGCNIHLLALKQGLFSGEQQVTN